MRGSEEDHQINPEFPCLSKRLLFPSGQHSGHQTKPPSRGSPQKPALLLETEDFKVHLELCLAVVSRRVLLRIWFTVYTAWAGDQGSQGSSPCWLSSSSRSWTLFSQRLAVSCLCWDASLSSYIATVGSFALVSCCANSWPSVHNGLFLRAWWG